MRAISFAFAAGLAAVVLAGCGPTSGTSGAATPMAQLPAFDQPLPRAPLLADSRPEPTPHYPVQVAAAQSLPAAVPLPPRAVLTEAKDDGKPDGGASPAAGYASGITDARGDGARHELDGKK